MLPSEASLIPNKEFVMLLPISIINGQDILTHSSLEGQDLKLCLVQQPEGVEERGRELLVISFVGEVLLLDRGEVVLLNIVLLNRGELVLLNRGKSGVCKVVQSYMPFCSLRVLSPEVIDVDDKPPSLRTHHFFNFLMIYSLIFLKCHN